MKFDIQQALERIVELCDDGDADAMTRQRQGMRWRPEKPPAHAHGHLYDTGTTVLEQS